MAIIKCKMCGGDIELSADKTVGTCEYCGSTMTFPKISDDQRAAAFNRGNHFRKLGEFDKALQVYERIVSEDEKDAEAHWCMALCRYGIEYVKDPVSSEYVPTCHRVSFDSFLEDVDYKAALEYADGVARSQYEKDGAKIAEVQRGILETVNKEEPFDVFICYKESNEQGQRTVDSTLAQDIYYQLAEKGYKVFFSRITLEDKGGQEYEPYIFAALHSAKVMLVIGTKPEYMNAVWVKNEWSRYLQIMKNDRKRLLIPCYRDMDPYDMPEQLSVLQSYDMSRIGFVQDLIRGISKVIDADKAPKKETVVIQNVASANVAPLLRRAGLFLEDRNFGEATAYFDKVLDQEPENADAYLGKMMAELKIQNKEGIGRFVEQEESPSGAVEGNANFRKFLRFADENSRKEVQGIIEAAIERRNAKLYERALSIRQDTEEVSQLNEAIRILRQIPDYRNSRDLIEKCEEQIKTILERKEEERKEKLFKRAIEQASQDGADSKKLQEAAGWLQSISGYKNAGELSEYYTGLSKELFEKEQKASYVGRKKKELTGKKEQIVKDMKENQEELNKLLNPKKNTKGTVILIAVIVGMILLGGLMFAISDGDSFGMIIGGLLIILSIAFLVLGIIGSAKGKKVRKRNIEERKAKAAAFEGELQAVEAELANLG
jgi:tetratricopeptide (TPR) repeat protein